MKENAKLTQQVGLRTHLTPQQVRFVRLLEMSGAEIEETVRNELVENPALEASDLDNSRNDGGEGDDSDESPDQLMAADYSDEDETPSYLLHATSSRFSSDDDMPGPIDRERHSPSLIESLNDQLNVVNANPIDIALARYLIGYLDDNGRLSRSLNEIADDISMIIGKEINREELIPALDIIRYQLDPPGLGAVDLRECLLIQLRRKQPRTIATRVATEIIEHYFDLFSKKHFDRLPGILGISKETLEEALEVIRSLDPKPGNSMTDVSSDRSSHITPDFIVSPVEGHPGRFSVVLNSHIPELTIEESFLTDGNDKASQMFIRRKREEANTFISLIQRRNRTLMEVMRAIVTLQQRFFETENPADLKPMILNDVAELTGLDRSVISRATSGKYVSTDGGIYPLKTFFNDTPIQTADASSAEVMAALKEIIDNENKKHPLSDRAISDALNRQGYDLARRTVTKYREKSNIPVARLRKEY